jgi:hypothetical protein
LFKVYPNKNAELRAAAKVCYEFGMNIAKEPSAGMSIGLDEHALTRQRSYVQAAKGYIEALHNRPIPDMPYVHPTRFDIDLTEVYTQFTKDGLPLNEDTELLAQYWMICAVEMAASQSAGLAGSLTDADYNRIANHLAVITQFLDEMESRPIPDVPETAFPAAALEVPGNAKK